MSDLGYQNKVQSQLNVGYNCLDSYISALEKAIRRHPSQYLWLHKRFKTRKEGDLPFYQ